MGVEYAHYFVVTDLSWIGGVEDALRVHAVLDKWSLVTADPTVYDRDGGRKIKIRGGLSRVPSSCRNFLIEYPGVLDSASIRSIMGPSYYPEDQIGERYFQRIAFEIGTDFHVHSGNEMYYVEVLQAPRNGSAAISAYPKDDLTYPATAATVPPKTKVTIERGEYKPLVPKEFTGVWRAALELDCGKDLPAIVERSNEVPGTGFAKDLAAALGTSVHQIGHVY